MAASATTHVPRHGDQTIPSVPVAVAAALAMAATLIATLAVAPSAADVTGRRLYFTSAGNGYERDVQNHLQGSLPSTPSPAAWTPAPDRIVRQAAPDGSKLSGSPSATAATAIIGATSAATRGTPGTIGSPTFSLPFTGSLTAVCIDAFAEFAATASADRRLTLYFRIVNSDGATSASGSLTKSGYAGTDVGTDPSSNVGRLTGRVLLGTALDVAPGASFVLYAGGPDSAVRFHYGGPLFRDASIVPNCTSVPPPPSPTGPVEPPAINGVPMFLRSAGGSYVSDVRNDTAAATGGRAPAGARLATVAATDTAIAAAEIAPSAADGSPGAPGAPTFSMPFQGALAALCVDIFASDDVATTNANLTTNLKLFFRVVNADDTSASGSLTYPAYDQGAVRITGRVVLTPPLTVAAGASFVLYYGSPDSATKIVYDATDRPSSVTANCGVNGTTPAPEPGPQPDPDPEPVDVETQTTYTGPATVSCGSRVTLAATVKAPYGAPVDEGTVTFTMDRDTWHGTFASPGSATAGMVVAEHPGRYALQIQYSGADGWAASSAENSVAVSRGTSRVSLKRAVVKGRSRLTATVTNAAGQGIGGVSVTFHRNTTKVATVRTSATGVAVTTTTRGSRGDKFKSGWSGDWCAAGSTGSVRA